MTDRSQLIKLDDERKSLYDNAVKLLDKIEVEADETRAQELQVEYDKIMGDVDKISERIDARQLLNDKIEEAEEARRQLEDIANRRIPKLRKQGDTDADADDVETRDAEYRKIFYDKFLKNKGFTTEDRAALDAMFNQYDPEFRVQSAGTDTAGGYMVPTFTEAEVIKTMAIWGPMYSGITRVVNTPTGARFEWPTVDDTANTGRQRDENAAAQEQDITVGQKMLDAFWYSTDVIKVSQQLLDDSIVNVEALIAELFGERAGRRANTMLTTGTGASQPMGIVTAATTGVTSTTKTAVKFDDLADLSDSIDDAYTSSPMCRYMFHQNTRNEIRKVKDSNNNYIWSMGDVRTGEPNTVWNFPYSINNAMDKLGASKNIVVFGDFSKYVVRRVRGLSIKTLRELYAINNQIGILGWYRFDGDLMDTAAVKKLVTAA